MTLIGPGLATTRSSRQPVPSSRSRYPGLVDQDAAGGRGGLRHRGQGLAVSRWDPSHLRSFRRKLGSATPPGVRVDIAALVR
jgi:hypothetical protein